LAKVLIERIIFNPWIPEPVFKSVKDVINKIDGCDRIEIDQTPLLDNEKWKKTGEKYIRTQRSF